MTIQAILLFYVLQFVIEMLCMDETLIKIIYIYTLLYPLSLYCNMIFAHVSKTNINKNDVNLFQDH
jgi:hypothetical protein